MRAEKTSPSMTVEEFLDWAEGRDGRYELGVVGERVRDERLAFEPVVRDQLLVVMRPEHPLANHDRLTLAELAEQRLVVREHGSATQATVDRALGEAGSEARQSKPFLQLGSVEAVKQALRAADLCAVLSEWSVRDEVASGQLRAVRGFADQDLRIKDNPADARNRRVSIVVRSLAAAEIETVLRGTKDATK